VHLAFALNGEKRSSEALRYVVRAVDMLKGPPPDARLGQAMFNLAATQHRLGRYVEAIETNEQVLAMWQGQFGANHPDMAELLRDLGASHHALGNTPRARQLLEQALAILERIHAPALDLADTRWKLSETLWTDDPARAATLARQARDAIQARLPGSPDVAEIDARLEAHTR
jgi:tetratricopeptide (TPR) repeat protein